MKPEVQQTDSKPVVRLEVPQTGYTGSVDSLCRKLTKGSHIQTFYLLRFIEFSLNSASLQPGV